MKKCYADTSLSVSKDKFPKPEEEMTINLDCSKVTSTKGDTKDDEPDDDKIDGIDFD